MATKKAQKNYPSFICYPCDYKTCKKNDFDRHLQTQKHFGNIATTNGNTNLVKEYKCDNCDKKYKDRTGLWKHKKTCVKKDVMEEKEVNLLVQYLMKENAEFKQLMLDQNKQMVELAKKSAGHHNTNTNNNNTNNNNTNNTNNNTNNNNTNNNDNTVPGDGQE